MNEEPQKNDIVDATDCLEAVSCFRSAKNFLFIVLIICLLVSQAVFWTAHLGYVDFTEDRTERIAEQVRESQESVGDLEGFDSDDANPEVQMPADVNTGDADEMISRQAEKAAEELNQEQGSPVQEMTETEMESVAAETADEIEETLVEEEDARFLVQAGLVKRVVALVNFVGLLAGILYVFSLLVSIKLSLVGRLGGAAHISAAFFLSLFAFVLLFPWQTIMPGMLSGAFYSPETLLEKWNVLNETLIEKVLYYVRFTGLWLISLLLFIGAQVRTRRWSKATMRRLGILR